MLIHHRRYPFVPLYPQRLEFFIHVILSVSDYLCVQINELEMLDVRV